MEIEKALSIIRPLSDGVDPFTGEEFPPNSPYQQTKVVRALYLAISILEKEEIRIRRQGLPPANAGKDWSREEENELAKEFDSGKSIKELSEIHQRTKWAIEARLSKLGKIQPRR